MGRLIGGVLAGVVTAIATIMLIELIGHQLLPVAGDAALRNPEAPVQAMNMPAEALMIAAFAWFAGAMVGGIVGRRIAGRRRAAWTVAAVVALAAIVNVMMLPHPFWMQIMAVVAPVLGGFVAAHLTDRKRGSPMQQRLESFRAFWPHYLREHSRPGTRALHYAGTSLVVLLAIGAVATGTWWLLVALPIAGYGFAWAGHMAVERNRPATFTYPAWSLAADFKMWWLWITGRIGPELRAAGVEPTIGAR